MLLRKTCKTSFHHPVACTPIRFERGTGSGRNEYRYDNNRQQRNFSSKFPSSFSSAASSSSLSIVAGVSVALSAAVGMFVFSKEMNKEDEKSKQKLVKGSHDEEKESLLPKEFIEKVKDLIGDENRVMTDEGFRQQYSKDFSYHRSKQLPDMIVFPTSTEEVSSLMKLCTKFKVPVIAYGGGTSLEGHVLSQTGGISLNFSQMNKVKVHIDDLDAVVQPGVLYEELNEDLGKRGLIFPLDPGPGATIGGMVGTSCSGTNAVRYGTMKENVISMEVVLADGTVVRTGQRARKSSAGYDLTHLFIGSEGTLGIVTSICLRLHQKPEKSSVAVCNFKSLEQATQSVISILQKGVKIGKVELLDEVMIRAVNLYSETHLEEFPTLFFEFSGSPVEVEEQIDVVQKITSSNSSLHFQYAKNEEEKAELWKARKTALWASNSLRPGVDMMITDVCVPISRLADAILQTKDDIKKTALLAPIVGHVGDGNFHLFLLFDSKDEKEMKQAKQFHDRLVKRAIQMEGTCTGEHGVGEGKREYLSLEKGPEAVRVMKQIKQTLDPLNLLNPGKVLPDDA